jgi:citrate synthase
MKTNPSSFSYGHGVLRNPDPRFIALQEFCDARPELQESSIIQLVKKARISDMIVGHSSHTLPMQTFEVAPGVLKEHGKVN